MMLAGLRIFGGGLIPGEAQIMVIYAYFHSFVMHFQRFAERVRLAHQYATSLSQGTIDGFDDAGLATALWTSLMGCRW